MSKHLSWRRRFSEPEKPEPRFQWRMRVNTLMMDEGSDFKENKASYHSKDSSRQKEMLGSVGRAEGAKKCSHPPETSQNADTPFSLTHKERRERFARTKSEGSIKLRVKFSRAIEADEDSSDASPELNRRRALPESVVLGEEDFSTRRERRYGRYQRCDSDSTSYPQATQKESEANIPRDHSDFRAGTNSGAIPKRFQEKRKPHRSYDSTSSDENDFRRRRMVTKSSSPDSAIGESLPNTQAVSRERSPSVTYHDKADLSDGEDGNKAEKSVQSVECDSGEDDLPLHVQGKTPNAILARDTKRKAGKNIGEVPYEARQISDLSPIASCSAGIHPSSSEEDVASDGGGGCDGAADDIESIIEKIIAEEEQGRGSPIGGNLVNRMEEMLGQNACKYVQELEELQETIADCNRETTFDLELSHRKNHISSSVPHAR